MLSNLYNLNFKPKQSQSSINPNNQLAFKIKDSQLSVSAPVINRLLHAPLIKQQHATVIEKSPVVKKEIVVSKSQLSHEKSIKDSKEIQDEINRIKKEREKNRALIEKEKQLELQKMQTENRMEKDLLELIEEESKEKKESYLLFSDIIITRQIDGYEYVYKNIPKSIRDLNRFILIVDFPNLGGGTTFFLNTIVSKYKRNNTFVIARNVNNKLILNINDDCKIIEEYDVHESIQMLDEIKHKIIKIFVNHTLYHNDLFIEKIFKLDKEVTTITHDYKTVFTNYCPNFNQIIAKDVVINNTIKNYDKVIIQNDAHKYIFNKFVKHEDQLITSSLPDFKYSSSEMYTNTNKYITIGIIGAISEIKGLKMLEKIYAFYEKNENIKMVVFGTISSYKLKIPHYKYDSINDFNDLLVKHKPNLILELSIVPETYSYTLTLAMLTQLPILYLNKPIPCVVKNRLSYYDKAYEFNTITELDNLIPTIKQSYFYIIKPILYYNPFWDDYFGKESTSKEPNENIYQKKKNTQDFKYGIQPYCIYFPQFHTFKENDKAYYEGYTDINNLDLLSRSNKNIQIESPLLSDLEIKNIKEYNLTNKNIIQKQIDILNDYNLSGFAIYYYWFSENSISGKNMLMDEVINNFFDTSIDLKERKVFFIWANEDWHKNPAFGNTSLIIRNEYTKDKFTKNANNLIKYFKSHNYLKINNKPVFFIHHPHMMDIEEINLFVHILNDICKQNNFGGIEIVLNSQTKSYTEFGYKEYNHHPNYKINAYRSKEIIDGTELVTMDYKNYVDNIKLNKNDIQTLFLNFDNRSRLFRPDFIKLATVCINITIDKQELFIKKIVESYKEKKKQTNTEGAVENILLINSWNEWGEKMTIEPSLEKGYFYLNLIMKLFI